MVLVSLPQQTHAQQGQSRSPWYLGVYAGTVFTDNERPASNGKLIGLTLGRRITAASAVEWEVYHSSTDFDAGFGVDQNAFRMNYVLSNPTPLWRPYILVGFGAFRYKAPGQSDTGLTVAVATGGQWDLGKNGSRLRAEIRYRYSDAESATPDLFKKGEPIISVGLMMPFGW